MKRSVNYHTQHSISARRQGRVQKKIVEFSTKGGRGAATPDFLLRKNKTKKKHGLKTLDFV